MPRKQTPSVISETAMDPRGERRAELMLDAAVAEFFDKGWRNARVSDIVARSGGSMATLYRAFGNKKGLARALITREASMLAVGLKSLNDDSLPPDHALSEAALAIIEIILLPETLLINRIAIGEGREVPEVRDMFFAENVAPAQDIVRRYLQRQHDLGRLHVPDPALAAQMFFMSLFGETLIRWISGIDQQPDADAMRRAAPAVVSIFIEGIRPRNQ